VSGPRKRGSIVIVASAMRRILAILLTSTIVLTLAATLAHSAVLGWIGVATFVATVLAYVAWRLEVRRGRVFDQ
jgi:hypothetical protein